MGTAEKQTPPLTRARQGSPYFPVMGRMTGRVTGLPHTGVRELGETSEGLKADRPSLWRRPNLHSESDLNRILVRGAVSDKGSPFHHSALVDRHGTKKLLQLSGSQ